MVIDAQGMSHKGKIKPFDLQIHKGEVVGLTGLLGSGRSELARVIYGADKNQTGKLFVNGKEAKINAPIDAMNLGMGLLPDDRKAEGIIADLSVRENIILAMQAKRGMFKLLPMSRQNEIADKYIDRAAADQDGEQGDPDRAALRRKPAEGDSGTLACHRSGIPYSG